MHGLIFVLNQWAEAIDILLLNIVLTPCVI